MNEKQKGHLEFSDLIDRHIVKTQFIQQYLSDKEVLYDRFEEKDFSPQIKRMLDSKKFPVLLFETALGEELLPGKNEEQFRAAFASLFRRIYQIEIFDQNGALDLSNDLDFFLDKLPASRGYNFTEADFTVDWIENLRIIYLLLNKYRPLMNNYLSVRSQFAKSSISILADRGIEIPEFLFSSISKPADREDYRDLKDLIECLREHRGTIIEKLTKNLLLEQKKNGKLENTHPAFVTKYIKNKVDESLQSMFPQFSEEKSSSPVREISDHLFIRAIQNQEAFDQLITEILGFYFGPASPFSA